MKLKLWQLLLPVLLITALQTNSQTIARLPNETAETFVKRAFAIDELPHPIIETGEWDSTKKVIIFFKRINSSYVAYLLTPFENNIYKTTIIDSIYQHGAEGEINIETVFFANADKDSMREIVIMTKVEASTPRYADRDLEGFWYNNYIYDNPDIQNPGPGLYYFEKMSETLSSGFEGKSYVKNTGKFVKKETAKYKTASSIRQALKDMGYPSVAAKH